VHGPYFCSVGAEGINLPFVQQTGPDRPWGSMFDDGEKRQILVGSRARGSEKNLPNYGDRPGATLLVSSSAWAIFAIA
jgi:hypothetical protein